MKPQRLPLPPVPAAALLLLPVALLAALLLVVYPNEFALQASLAGAAACGDHQGGGGGGGVQAAPEFRLLIGVLTLPARYERRHLLRMVYALQQPAVASRARVDVRFVFCRVGSPEDRVLVSLEAMAYGDVVELDCPENMDNGKTHAYFSSVPRLFGGGEAAYDFVMKADDDTFFRLPELAESLSRAPRRDLYYGCMVPCDYVRGSNEYMSGMGYLLSWDLVEWIVAAAAEIEGRTGGPEDRTLYSWLRRGGRGRNRVDVKPAMYNFPGRHPCSHEFIPDTIAVHQLKDNRRWARTLQYFNFTAALKPFYPATSSRFPATSFCSLCLRLLLPLGLVAMALSSLVVLSVSGCLSAPRSRPVVDNTNNDGGLGAETTAAREPEFRLLVGVLTTPSRYERRGILRLAYALQPAPGAQVDVRFVLCDVTDAADAVLVAAEAARHGDILVLDGCSTENMNDGKTHAYLSSVPRLFAPCPYDYVMKADDDTYLRVAALADELRGKPRRTSTSAGATPSATTRCRSCTAWATSCPGTSRAGCPPTRTSGRNRYNLKPRMYDINWDMDEFRPNTIAVHRLKNNRRWAAVFRHFNVTLD
uniref:Hexosyltransferase n=1 Tax=Oryza rufipogon TaxID=4529 RepID=A0A0E0QRS5_ORYRU